MNPDIAGVELGDEFEAGGGVEIADEVGLGGGGVPAGLGVAVCAALADGTGLGPAVAGHATGLAFKMS